MRRQDEPALLIAAIRRFLNPEAPLPDFTNIDWTKLLRLADAHAVTPMLFTALECSQIPDSVAEQLRSQLETSVVRSLGQAAELVRLVGLLEGQKIEVVALKGPTLSRYLYGDVGSRVSGDIDVLIKPDAVLHVRDVLVANGYSMENTLH